MRSPLRNQIFFPIAGLFTLTVVLLTGISAWHASDVSRAQTRRHMDAVAQALGNASYPLTDDVVRRIGAMIGGDVVALDGKKQITASTIVPDEELYQALLQLDVTNTTSSSSAYTIRWKSQDHLVTAIHRSYVPRPGTLFVMLPQNDFRVLWGESFLLPLFVAVPVLVTVLWLAMLISGRIARRVDDVRELFKRLASGQFHPVSVSGRNDEIRDLMTSANDLSAQLCSLQERMVAAERLQLLGQLSGGLAHQLKNSIAGARLAIQLHQRNCSQEDEMIRTAIAQLNLTEEQVMAVMSLRPDSETENTTESCDLRQLVKEVVELLQPHCSHWQSTVTVTGLDKLMVQLRSKRSVKGAVLNLVQNAIEAAGVAGLIKISISLERSHVVVQIVDSGPGFPAGKTSMMEPFHTSKPEGIGLGLTIAHHAIEQESGKLIIGQLNGQTAVTLQIPLSKCQADSQE